MVGEQSGPGLAGRSIRSPRGGLPVTECSFKENIMAWTKPAAVDMRYGFEINLYVAAR